MSAVFTSIADDISDEAKRAVVAEANHEMNMAYARAIGFTKGSITQPETFTARDQFAAQAMAAVISNERVIADTPDAEIASYSFRMADAMMKARKHEEPTP